MMPADFDPEDFLKTYKPAGAAPAGAAFDPADFLKTFKPAAAAPQGPKIVQEMHPDFTAGDRLVTKNFAADNEAAVTYLEKKHPELEISVDKSSGQILAKRRDGSDGGDYRTLDPKTGLSGTLTDPKELALTVGGAGYDLAAGGLATGAGILGGLATKSLTGAMAAGGGVSAGLEGLREKLGDYLGMGRGLDAGRIALAGAGGAAAPLLFGSGATAGQVAARAAATGGDAAALAASQRGLLGRGLDAARAAVGLGRAGGAAAPAAAEAFGPPVQELPPELARADAMKRLKAALGGAGAEPVVDARAAAEPLKTAIADAQAVADRTKTEASNDTLAALKKQFSRLFTSAREVEEPAGLVETGRFTAPVGSLDRRPIMTAGAAVKRSVTEELEHLTPLETTKIEERLADLVRQGQGKNAGADERHLADVAAEIRQRLQAQLEPVLSPEAAAARADYLGVGEKKAAGKAAAEAAAAQPPQAPAAAARDSAIAQRLAHLLARSPGAAAGSTLGYAAGQQIDPHGMAPKIGGAVGGLLGGGIAGPGLTQAALNALASGRGALPAPLAPAAMTSAWNSLGGT